jgi:hypothetical protein
MFEYGGLLYAIGTVALMIGLPVLVSVLYKGKDNV